MLPTLVLFSLPLSRSLSRIWGVVLLPTILMPVLRLRLTLGLRLRLRLRLRLWLRLRRGRPVDRRRRRAPARHFESIVVVRF